MVCGSNKFEPFPSRLSRRSAASSRWTSPPCSAVGTDPSPDPIVKVSGCDAGDWRGTVGQTHVLEIGPEGSIRETVVGVDEPHSWTHRITDFKGPVAALLDRIEAEFRSNAAGTGTRIHWQYNMFARSHLAASALPAFGWFWRG